MRPFCSPRGFSTGITSTFYLERALLIAVLGCVGSAVAAAGAVAGVLFLFLFLAHCRALLRMSNFIVSCSVVLWCGGGSNVGFSFLLECITS